MAQKFDKKLILFFIAPFIADRLTKYFIISNFWQPHTINPFFNICLTHNRGIAWGLANHLQNYQFLYLNFLITAVLFYFAWYMKSIAHHRKMLAACLLIISGGISNFFDRFWYGAVIDFIQLHVSDWYFPVFNVADISITFGALFLAYLVLFDEEK